MIEFYNTKRKSFRDRSVVGNALLRIIPHNTTPNYKPGEICVYPVGGMAFAQGDGVHEFVWDVGGKEIGRSMNGILTFTPLFLSLAVDELYKLFPECRSPS